MTEHTRCTYSGDRIDALMMYFYGEAGAEGAAFDRHLAGCAACREELDALRGVRGRLAEWAPPEPAGALAPQAVATSPRRRLWRALGEIPVWAQIAAASLIVGVSAGAANLSVRYGADGLTIRSGWWPAEAAAPSAPPSEPWRAELASLRSDLESSLAEVRTAATARQDPTAAPAAANHDDAIMRQVRSLIEESDRRHQRELALRVGEVLRDVNAQRRADLVNIDRSLGTLQNNMGVELLKQREQVNNYMLRVSSQK